MKQLTEQQEVAVRAAACHEFMLDKGVEIVADKFSDLVLVVARGESGVALSAALNHALANSAADEEASE